MKSRTPFTRKDVFVVLVCAVFLLMVLGAIGSGGRRRAKEAVCLSNLRQWGSAFMMFAADNDGYFMEGRGGDNWWSALEPYYKDRNLLLCPMATDPGKNPWESYGNFGTWGPSWFPEGFYGSYGVNEWVCNPPDPHYGHPEKYWRTPNAAGAGGIPLLADAYWDQGWPESYDLVPSYSGEWVGATGDDMSHFVLIRHDGAINGVFLDGSCRRIELKCLWNLNWHRGYPVDIIISEWPSWMDELPDCDLQDRRQAGL